MSQPNFGGKPFIVFAFLFHGVIDTINERSQKPQPPSLPDDPECTTARAPTDKQEKGSKVASFFNISLLGLHPGQNQSNKTGLPNCSVSVVSHRWYVWSVPFCGKHFGGSHQPTHLGRRTHIISEALSNSYKWVQMKSYCKSHHYTLCGLQALPPCQTRLPCQVTSVAV